jgi:hypothetical protein
MVGEAGSIPVTLSGPGPLLSPQGWKRTAGTRPPCPPFRPRSPSRSDGAGCSALSGPAQPTAWAHFVPTGNPGTVDRYPFSRPARSHAILGPGSASVPGAEAWWMGPSCRVPSLLGPAGVCAQIPVAPFVGRGGTGAHRRARGALMGRRGACARSSLRPIVMPPVRRCLLPEGRVASRMPSLRAKEVARLDGTHLECLRCEAHTEHAG